jgi:hypothetical protein
MSKPSLDARVRLANELASRLDTLLPPSVRIVEGSEARLHLFEADETWGGVDLSQVDA